MLYGVSNFKGSVGIGTENTNSNAILELNSIDKGLLLPRLSEVERDNILLPTFGLFIYNTTTNKINFYNGTTWIDPSESSSLPGGNDTEIQFNNNGNFDGASTLLYDNVLNRLNIQSNSITNIPIVLKGFTGQTSNLLNVLDGIDNNILSISNIGQILLNNGSVTTPSLSFIGDTNTGIYSSSPNIISFSTNSDLRLEILETKTVVQDELEIIGTGNALIDITTSNNILEIQGNGSIILPSGTTSERPSLPENGMMRYNTDDHSIEARLNGTWVPLNPGTGTVFTINTGIGLSGGPITASGTISVDITSLSSIGTIDGLDELMIYDVSTGNINKVTASSLGLGNKYVFNFNSNTDWGSPVSGYYIINILQTTHLKGTDPFVQVFELVGGSYELVNVDLISHNISGDVIIRILETPDTRFEGKVVIW